MFVQMRSHNVESHLDEITQCGISGRDLPVLIMQNMCMNYEDLDQQLNLCSMVTAFTLCLWISSGSMHDVCRQQKPISDCMDVQPDLSLCYLHMH